MLITNYCVPDEKYPENTFKLFIFRVNNNLRGEKREKKYSNSALIKHIFPCMPDSRVTFDQGFFRSLSGNYYIVAFFKCIRIYTFTYECYLYIK